MTEQPNIIDELERRLIASYYADSKATSPAVRGLQLRWVPAAGSIALAAVAAVMVLVLVSSGVNAPTAQAALDRAADAASNTGATPMLGASEVWTARVIQTSVYSQTLPTSSVGSPRTVAATRRAVSDVRITQTGRVIDRSVSSESFVNRADAARYGKLLSGTQSSITTTIGRGKLASPLLPTQPLLSYQALMALPDQVPQLRRAITTLIANIFAAQKTSTGTSNSTATATATATTSPATGGTVTSVGSCCGANSEDRQAVASLNAIAWLLALPVRPAVRAALYRTAATLPGVRYDGTASDALGRPGVEISVGSSNDELQMIFNQGTGALLAITTSFGNDAAREGFGPITLTLERTAVAG